MPPKPSKPKNPLMPDHTCRCCHDKRNKGSEGKPGRAETKCQRLEGCLVQEQEEEVTLPGGMKAPPGKHLPGQRDLDMRLLPEERKEPEHPPVEPPPPTTTATAPASAAPTPTAELATQPAAAAPAAAPATPTPASTVVPASPSRLSHRDGGVFGVAALAARAATKQRAAEATAQRKQQLGAELRQAQQQVQQHASRIAKLEAAETRRTEADAKAAADTAAAAEQQQRVAAKLEEWTAETVAKAQSSNTSSRIAHPLAEAAVRATVTHARSVAVKRHGGGPVAPTGSFKTVEFPAASTAAAAAGTPRHARRRHFARVAAANSPHPRLHPPHRSLSPPAHPSALPPSLAPPNLTAHHSPMLLARQPTIQAHMSDASASAAHPRVAAQPRAAAQPTTAPPTTAARARAARARAARSRAARAVVPRGRRGTRRLARTRTRWDRPRRATPTWWRAGGCCSSTGERWASTASCAAPAAAR